MHLRFGVDKDYLCKIEKTLPTNENIKDLSTLKFKLSVCQRHYFESKKTYHRRIYLKRIQLIMEK